MKILSIGLILAGIYLFASGVYLFVWSDLESFQYIGLGLIGIGGTFGGVILRRAINIPKRIS